MFGTYLGSCRQKFFHSLTKPFQMSFFKDLKSGIPTIPWRENCFEHIQIQLQMLQKKAPLLENKSTEINTNDTD